MLVGTVVEVEEEVVRWRMQRRLRWRRSNQKEKEHTTVQARTTMTMTTLGFMENDDDEEL